MSQAIETGTYKTLYGSGMIPMTRMVRSGLVFDIIGFLLIIGLIPVMARVAGLV